MAVDVKVCGLVRPEDAETAAASGAAYLGVVFAESRRRVDAAVAASIVRAAGAVPVLAVFGTTDTRDILRAHGAAGFSGVQLHGSHTLGDAHALQSAGLLVWRVARLGAFSDLDRLEATAEAADAVLIEPFVAHADGGAGVALRLELAIAARERLRGVRMVLAGGLRPETVRRTVALVAPDAVDVSSGVEIRPGVKHAARIARFMEALA